MIQVAVCDDEPHIASELSGQIKNAFAGQGMTADIHPFTSVLKMTAQMRQTSFDVLFLDIDMPEMDGVDLGKHLRSLGVEAGIVYISNHDERVFETFKIAPLHFIRKNHFHDEIDETVQVIWAWWTRRQDRYLTIKSCGIIETVSIDDIIYVEALNKKQNIVTTSRTIPIKNTLNVLEGKLLDHGFLKPHKGYLVNYRAVDYIKGDAVVLKNGASIPISRLRLAEIKRAYLKLFSKNLLLNAEPIHEEEINK